jgi:hypothetical protein
LVVSGCAGVAGVQGFMPGKQALMNIMVDSPLFTPMSVCHPGAWLELFLSLTQHHRQFFCVWDRKLRFALMATPVSSLRLYMPLITGESSSEHPER